MGNSFRRSIVLGGLLIVAGLLFLLSNLGIINIGHYLIGGLFCLGGLYFLSIMLESRNNWWGVIPGVVLLDLGALIILSGLLPYHMSRLGGAFFLGGISLAFWVVYFRMRDYWWAIIPAGVLATLACITLVEFVHLSGMIVPAILFLGIAGTFLLVYFLNGREPRFKWTWYPAAILGVMGTIFLFFAGRFGSVVMPAALIILGIYLVGKTFVKKSAE